MLCALSFPIQISTAAPSLRAKRSNPFCRKERMDCFVASLLGRSCWIEESGGLRYWLELDVKAELFKTSNEPAGLEFEGAPIKVGGGEVMVLGTVFEDVVDGSEDRCRNSA